MILINEDYEKLDCRSRARESSRLVIPTTIQNQFKLRTKRSPTHTHQSKAMSRKVRDHEAVSLTEADRTPGPLIEQSLAPNFIQIVHIAETAAITPLSSQQ